MAVVLTVKVVPQSGRQELIWDEKQGVLKLFLKSVPKNNKANDELLVFFRKLLGVSRDDLAIMTGHTARRKRIRVTTDLSESELLACCGVRGVQQQLSFDA